MPESDDELMERFCRGDELAFEALYARHAAGVHAFLRRMVGAADVADDLLQVTFLSVVRARGRYEPRTNVRAWLLAIAANAARDARRRGRVREGGRAVLANEPAPEPPPLPDPPAARAVQAALSALPPDQREALLLHKMQGLSFPEIAEALGIGVSAAKVRAHRGYEKLRALLARLEEP